VREGPLMGWRNPEWIHYQDYVDTHRADADTDDWCDQCERVRTETCPACGDEEELHAA
jgi:hypothetical protein